MRTAAIRQQSDPSPRSELDKVLQNELDQLQQRVLQTGKGEFFFDVTGSAKEFLLRNGLQRRCGALHLKLAIERHIVFPLADLFATDQVLTGGRICIDQDQDRLCLIFTHRRKESGGSGSSPRTKWTFGTYSWAHGKVCGGTRIHFRAVAFLLMPKRYAYWRARCRVFACGSRA
jgi:C-terminal, D2-small domain, of ClpB protein